MYQRTADQVTMSAQVSMGIEVAAVLGALCAILIAVITMAAPRNTPKRKSYSHAVKLMKTRYLQSPSRSHAHMLKL